MADSSGLAIARDEFAKSTLKIVRMRIDGKERRTTTDYMQNFRKLPVPMNSVYNFSMLPVSTSKLPITAREQKN